MELNERLYCYRADVIRIVDGDTLRVNVDLGDDVLLRNKAVRLIGVDTPEIRGLEKEQGDQWTEWVRGWLQTNGWEVFLHSRERDSFGRWLGVVWSQASKNCLNDDLLSAGSAAGVDLRYQKGGPKKKT